MGCWATRIVCRSRGHTDDPEFGHKPTYRRDTLCWCYTKNGQYIVNSGYWVARNILKNDEENDALEPSITKLQAFLWKIKAPQKI